MASLEEKGRRHSIHHSALLKELGTSETGLSLAEASSRLKKNGLNSLVDIKQEPWYSLLMAQFNSLPIMLLAAAAIISLAIGLMFDPKKLIDASAITIAILIAALFGFFQEYKAEKAIEALKKMVVQRSVVIRGGKDYSISSSEIVVGDIVIIEEGSRVPADMRIIEATNLEADQSMLTGESRPSTKSAGAVHQKTPLSDQSNMLFSGTIVVRGHCKGVVVATGMGTEFGKIVGIVSTADEPDTPLQRSLDDLSKKLGIIGILAAVLFFIVGISRGEEIAQMLVVAVTLAVAVIPEGLPTVLAITLALGAQRMAQKNAIVRKMAAVETLGSATVICTDKTGTITQNRMAVQEVWLAGETYKLHQSKLEEEMVKSDPCLKRAMEVCLLCNNAMEVESAGKMEMVGDPTEVALLLAVSNCCSSFEAMRLKCKLLAEIPFDSNRKMMTVVRHYGNGKLAFIKGASERIIQKSARIMTEKGEKKMTAALKAKFLGNAKAMGDNGYRVIALAYRDVNALKSFAQEKTERDLVFVGLIGMEDPPRSEVRDALALCKLAGIKVIMVTGDSVTTAKAIARQVGLLSDKQIVVDGPELEAMDDSALRLMLPKAGVFARVTPEQKYRIVNALIGMGEVVAVTGDGVNDAPALRRANIGVAMGVSGTDVSKEVADIVLTDDNFASIVRAVRYGRTIFNNIKSFVRYQLSTNIGAIALMFSSPLLSLPLPLAPLQILWINIMVDGPPALALGMEPPTKTEMDYPPRNPKASFMSINLLLSILFTGAIMGFTCLSVYEYYLANQPIKAPTAVFTLFVFMQLVNALNCRSPNKSIFFKFASNPALLLAIVASFGIHMAIVYYPSLENVFNTVPLSLEDFAIIIPCALTIFVYEEFKKKHLRHTTTY